MTPKVSITDNIAIVRSQIGEAARSAGRDPGEIKLVAATKTVSLPQIAEAIKAGLTDFGENRVQEALPKIASFPQVNWHLIGHLQRNKVKDVIGKFSLIHSVDSERLAREISGRYLGPGTGYQGDLKAVPVLIEVNVSGEASKYGVTPEQLFPLLQVISGFANISVEGLMTVAPIVPDPEKARPYFARLKALSERIKEQRLPNVVMKYLSMGMTDDFPAAIKEGSNLVRIGRGIFGQRS